MTRRTMKFFSNDKKKSEAPNAPPSYEEIHGSHPDDKAPEYSESQFSNSQYRNFGPNEYPPEKPSSGMSTPSESSGASTGLGFNGHPGAYMVPPNSNIVPPNTYMVPPNISMVPPNINMIPPYTSMVPPNTSMVPPNFMVPPNTSMVPPNTYMVAPQLVNIAYDTDGRFTRPEYLEYLARDQQRVAQGDYPKPREQFGNQGAPLNPGKKSNKLSGGVFPGKSGATYHEAAKT